MDAEFWLTRWRQGRIGFHQAHVTPLLPQYWPALGVPAGSRVLVPLCGKSLDMLWLLEQGFDVLGVELSPLAVEQLFAENGLQARQRPCAAGPYWQANYRANTIGIVCGDIFLLDAAMLASCTAVYDRAALVALPAAMRSLYVRHVYGQLEQLVGDWRGLLLTLDYEPSQTGGPPFSVSDEEVQTLYRSHARTTLLYRQDILAQEAKAAERGLTRMETRVYQLAGLAHRADHQPHPVRL